MRRSILQATLVVLVGGCASTDNPVGDDGGAPDGQPPSWDTRVPYPDLGSPSKIGTNCQPTDTQVLHENTEKRSGWLPRIAWAAGQYGVVWAQEMAVENTIKAFPAFVRVSPTGQSAGAPVQLSAQLTARSTEPVAIAGFSSGEFAVAWGDNGGGDGKSDILLRMIDRQGRPKAPGIKITSSEAASYPYLVRPAFIGVEGALDVKELALAWRDGRLYEGEAYPGGPELGRHDIYFKVVNLDGSDKIAEKRITTDESLDKPTSPVLAHDGAGYVLVWKDDKYITEVDLLFTSLDGTGAQVSPEQALVTNYGLLSSSPDLVSIGPEFGVAYSENPSKDSGSIRFSRVDKSGNVMANQQVFTGGNPCTPAVAFNGERYALVWQDNCGQDGSKLVFAIIDDGGNPIKPDGSSCYSSDDPACGIVTISPSSEGVAAFPEMISVGGKFAVTWMNAPQDRIYFSHVTCTE